MHAGADTDTATATAPTLSVAIGALAAADAQGRDGRGFSGRDARLGARLAAIPEGAWSPQMRHAAWQLAQRHRFQLLAAHRIDPADIPEPPAAGDGPVVVRVVFTRERQIVVAFNFDPALHQAMLALPERYYDRQRKDWTLPASRQTAEALAGLLSAHTGFTVEPET